MPDPMFQTFFRSTETITWAPTEVIRDRARRRTRRMRVAVLAAVAVAVGLVLGGVAVALPNGAAPPPTSTPTPSTPTPSTPTPSTRTPSTPSPAPHPAPTSISDAMFLQPEDLGPGYAAVGNYHGSGDWTFEFDASVLGCPPSQDFPTPIAIRERALSRGPMEADDFITQYVASHRPGEATRYLDEIRARTAACRPRNAGSIAVAAQRFAGEDSLLIEIDFGGGVTTKLVLVRQGDLLTEFFGRPERGRAESEALGRTAAARLR